MLSAFGYTTSSTTSYAASTEPRSIVASIGFTPRRAKFAAYEAYEFHTIYQKVHNFCVVDLGGIYLDVTKDRTYTMPTESAGRRSAQTAMYHIAEAMVRWLAPILSFTAEEMWKFLPGKRAESVFLTTWYSLPEVPNDGIDWDKLLELRAGVLKKLEEKRVKGEIGSSLAAEVEVLASGDRYQALAALRDDLRFVLITSQAQVVQVGSEAEEMVKVRASRHAKCPRCWHYRADVGTDSTHPDLCGRCVANLRGAGEPRTHA